MKRAMSNKEAKDFISKVSETYGQSFSKKDRLEQDEDIIIINNAPDFFFYKDRVLPTLRLMLKNNFLKKVTVDMGAVRFVASGADIMRPGIRKIDGGINKAILGLNIIL